MMKNIRKRLFNGDTIIEWESDNGFGYAAKIGDHIQIWTDNYPDNPVEGIITVISYRHLDIEKDGYDISFIFDDITEIHVIEAG